MTKLRLLVLLGAFAFLAWIGQKDGLDTERLAWLLAGLICWFAADAVLESHTNNGPRWSLATSALLGLVSCLSFSIGHGIGGGPLVIAGLFALMHVVSSSVNRRSPSERPDDQTSTSAITPWQSSLSISCVVLLPLVSFVLGTRSMGAPVTVLLFGGVVVLLLRTDRDTLRRMHTSLLIGTAMAWVLLPHTVLDYCDPRLGIAGAEALQRLAPLTAHMPDRRVLALAGFPIQQICASGSGSWKLFYHLPSDYLVHASNCLLLAIVSWVAMGFVPRRRWVRVHWIAWSAFLPLCFYGFFRMLRWWD